MAFTERALSMLRSKSDEPSRRETAVTPEPETAGATVKAVWNGTVLATSDNTIVVEGNHYFPADSVNREYFRESTHHTTCPWKGSASYYDIVVGDQENKNAAWYYPEPKSAAQQIKGYVAFWKGVSVG